MLKKLMYLVAILLIPIMLSGCTFLDKYNEYLEDYDEFQEYKAYKEMLQENQSVSANDPVIGEPITTDPGTTDESQKPQNGGDEITPPTLDPSLINSPELLNLYVSQRNEVYTWENSYAKTMKINELDKKILEAGSYSFDDIESLFIGDSVTEGVGGKLSDTGDTISYVEYVNEVLKFKDVKKYGMAGRTTISYGDPIYSMNDNRDNLMYIFAKTVVIYVGINDYLAYSDEKRFGLLDSGFTSGYSGAWQDFSNFLNSIKMDQDFFIVTAYQVTAKDTSKFADYDGNPTLNDYMEIQRILAKRNGYHLIDLYNCGLMSQADEDTMNKLFSDSMHPNDAGYQVIGDHIAAEILLYYLGISTE